MRTKITQPTTWPAKFVVLSIVAFATAGTANAASYGKLLKDGYATGKLTKNNAGNYGWNVTSAEKRYFCKLKSAIVYVGKSGMISFTSSGRQLKLNRKVFEAKTGGHNKNIPQLADLKAGKLKPSYVGRCLKIK